MRKCRPDVALLIVFILVVPFSLGNVYFYINNMEETTFTITNTQEIKAQSIT